MQDIHSHPVTYHIAMVPKRGKARRAQSGQARKDKASAERPVAMAWMRRLKSLFDIDIEICKKCKAPVKIIACLEDPITIEKIFGHLKETGISNHSAKV